MIRLVCFILIWMQFKIISNESAWVSWSFKFGILLFIFWKNNLYLSGWIFGMVLDIFFEIDCECSADFDRFILFVSLRSRIIISLDQNDESVNAFVGFKIFIKPFRKLIVISNFYKRWIQRISILNGIEADRSRQ